MISLQLGISQSRLNLLTYSIRSQTILVWETCYKVTNVSWTWFHFSVNFDIYQLRSLLRHLQLTSWRPGTTLATTLLNNVFRIILPQHFYITTPTNNLSYNYRPTQLKQRPVSSLFEHNNGWRKTYLYTSCLLIIFISVANKVCKYVWSYCFLVHIKVTASMASYCEHIKM